MSNHTLMTCGSCLRKNEKTKKEKTIQINDHTSQNITHSRRYVDGFFYLFRKKTECFMIGVSLVETNRDFLVLRTV